MKLPKYITPIGLISSILVVGSLAGGIFAVDARYFSRAEAAGLEVSMKQRTVETDLQITNLEIKMLEELTKNNLHDDDVDIDDLRRLKFLYDKRLLLEKHQLDLIREK